MMFSARDFVGAGHGVAGKRVGGKLDSMTEADMQLPYRHYQPTATDDTPIIRYIHWDTVPHYGEHLLWLSRIVESVS